MPVNLAKTTHVSGRAAVPESSNREQPGGAAPLFAGRYRILAEVAHGGMGVVYKARDESTQSLVALKQLRTESAKKPRLAELFAREYQTLAQLAHPYIIRVYEYGISATGPYYTMELLEGGADLHGVSPLPYREACGYLRDVATSLSLLHARRFVHRDVTPRNVYRSAAGRCKLLDFGALASFGASTEIVGTAPYVAPEVMHQQPLDERTDLYSLGALAYWLLTGHNAYPARRLEDLFELWRHRPALPSKYNADIPAELDELVLTLVSPDLRARPRYAAEVIERLNVIAELEPEPESNAAALTQSYLTNVQLVGREPLLAQLDVSLENAFNGGPGQLLVVAESGFGRTRLLSEAALKARLLGFVVVRADAEGTQPFATAQLLANALLDMLPGPAHEAARPHAPVLATLSSELASRLGVSVPARNPRLAGEWGEQVTEALRRWITGIAEQHCVLLAVDNLEHADEASLSLLASLRASRRALRLLTLGTCLPLEAGGASPALRALARASELLELKPLSETDTADLLRAVFGAATNLSRCSSWIHELTAGRPLHCIELVNVLLSDGCVRFSDGIWLLPAERPHLTVPADLAEALASRLNALSVEALALAQALSLCRGSLTFELCLALAQRQQQSAYRVLDDLIQSGTLVAEGKFCRFANEAMRQAITLTMTPEAQRAHHCELGEILLTLPNVDLFTQLQAGSHLMDGGQGLRGADCVWSVAVASMEDMRDTVHLFAPILARAHDELRLAGRSQQVRLPILLALADAAFYADWRWAQRYGQQAIDAIEHVLGITLARRMQRFVGRRLAIVGSLLFASLRFTLLRPRHYPSLSEIFSRSVGSVSALVGAAASVLDRPTAERATETLRAMSWLGKRSALDVGHDLCQAILLLMQDTAAMAASQLEDVISRFQDAGQYRELSRTARLLWTGGARYALGINQTMKASDESVDTAKSLAHDGIALHRMLAHQLRLAYHLCRGELDRAAAYHQAIESHAVHVGSAWQAEIWQGAISSVLFWRSGDVVNAKRVSEQFADLGRRFPSVSHYSLMCRAGLSMARGDFSAGQRLWLEVLEGRAPRSFAGWLLACAGLAAAYNGRGQHLQAEQLCQKTLEDVQVADAAYPYASLWIHLELALAEAGLDKCEAASARLDVLIAANAAGENPFLRGSLHACRARVALSAGDERTFDAQVSEAGRWLLATNNPALVSRFEQLRLLALKAPWRTPSDRAPAISETLAQIAGSSRRAERSQLALDAILKLSHAHAGVLLELVHNELRVAASTGYADVPEAALVQARTFLDELSGASTHTFGAQLSSAMTSADTAREYRVLPLTIERAGELQVVGAIVLPESARLDPPALPDLEQIARSLVAEDIPSGAGGEQRTR